MSGRASRALQAVALVVLMAVLPAAFVACGEDATGGPVATTVAPASSVGTPAASVTSTTAAGTATTDAAPVATPAAVPSPDALVPAAISGVPLSGWVGGDQARAQVEQLHGKTLGQGMDEAWVADYGGGTAVLWVTRAVRPEDARDLYDRMVERIAVGDSPFTAQQPISIPGVEGYSLDGLGQKHYYFLVEGDLYWLAVDAGLAQAGLEEVVAQSLTTAGVE